MKFVPEKTSVLDRIVSLTDLHAEFDCDPHVVKYVTELPRTWEQVCWLLEHPELCFSRYMVALNTEHLDLLEIYVKHEDPVTRAYAARNPIATQEMLEEFAQRPDALVGKGS